FSDAVNVVDRKRGRVETQVRARFQIRPAVLHEVDGNEAGEARAKIAIRVVPGAGQRIRISRSPGIHEQEVAFRPDLPPLALADRRFRCRRLSRTAGEKNDGICEMPVVARLQDHDAQADLAPSFLRSVLKDLPSCAPHLALHSWHMARRQLKRALGAATPGACKDGTQYREAPEKYADGHPGERVAAKSAVKISQTSPTHQGCRAAVTKTRSRTRLNPAYMGAAYIVNAAA